MTERQFIYFDLGWTLEDETKSRLDQAKKACFALQEFEIQTDYNVILNRQAAGAKRMIRANLFEYAIASFGLSEDEVKIVRQKCPMDMGLSRLYADAEMVLRTLKQSHFIGLIANQPLGTEERLIRYGIRDSFDIVLASAEIGYSKPDIRIFQEAQKAANASSNLIWMIGDRIDKDIRPAKSLGWRTMRILQGHNQFQEPINNEDIPDFNVMRLSEIPEIINEA